MKKIFIIAGEASGDKIGAKLIKRLNELASFEFLSIGGEEMQKQNVSSIFPIENISLMGFTEIVPHIFKLKKLITQTISTIKKFDPDIVVTIDSPGFCYRVASEIKCNSRAKLIHIVAPSVWAYKPGRAKKFAKIYDLLLTLLPFEPEFFLKEGLNSKFVGHFIFEDNLCSDPKAFRLKYKIKNYEKLICITPGSRAGEVKKHLAIFLDSISIVAQRIKSPVRIVVLASSKKMNDLIALEIKKRSLNNVITTCNDKFEAYKAADVALAKSGTNSLEIALHATPQIVCYKMSLFTWLYIKTVAKIRFANLINIIAGKEIIPELLQDNCNAEKISENLLTLLENPEAIETQIRESKSILETMRNVNGSASEISAREILNILN